MFNPLYLLTLLPTFVVATLLLRYLRLKQQEAEKGSVPATVARRRAVRRTEH